MYRIETKCSYVSDKEKLSPLEQHGRIDLCVLVSINWEAIKYESSDVQIKEDYYLQKKNCWDQEIS